LEFSSQEDAKDKKFEITSQEKDSDFSYCKVGGQTVAKSAGEGKMPPNSLTNYGHGSIFADTTGACNYPEPMSNRDKRDGGQSGSFLAQPRSVLSRGGRVRVVMVLEHVGKRAVQGSWSLGALAVKILEVLGDLLAKHGIESPSSAPN
jgi:hypothetical protein